MKRITIGFGGFGIVLLTLLLMACKEGSAPLYRSLESEPSVQVSQDLNRDMLDSVAITTEENRLFVSIDTLQAIATDLTGYFRATNEARWNDLLHYYPLHKTPNDSSMRNNMTNQMEEWTKRGVKNRTAAAEIMYASKVFLDGDQEVVLLNMDLLHFVEFYPYYDGPRPDGLKGMINSSYGKNNGTYKETFLAPGDSIPLKYWEVEGLSRIWAVSHVDSSHWCFLPPNFNETGASSMMGGNAMVEALRHRRTNDPTAEK